MSGNRLTIFDTTLRDGEQAPGFSLRIDEKLALARQLRTLGVDIIEAGFPIASEADAEAVRMVSTHVQGPVIAALARCHAKDIERAAWALVPGAAPPHPRLHRHVRPAPRAEAAHVARGVPARRRWPRSAWRGNHTDDVQFSAEDATRSDPDFLCQIIEAVIQAGAKTINLPDTVGYSTPDEVGDFFRSVIGARAQLGPGDLQRALPRRSRPRGGEHAGRARRRRAAGRVHDQRDRRAGRERVAGGDRHGDSRPRRSPALHAQHHDARRSTRRASC